VNRTPPTGRLAVYQGRSYREEQLERATSLETELAEDGRLLSYGADQIPLRAKDVLTVGLCARQAPRTSSAGALHTLRHFRATHLQGGEAGADARTIASLLG
jgi:site-specific recombinase XerD